MIVSPTISVGDVSGRELDPTEVGAEHVRGRAPEQGLGAAGRAFQQDVPSCERGDQQELDGLALTDDDLADLLLRPLAQLGKALVGGDGLFHVSVLSLGGSDL